MDTETVTCSAPQRRRGAVLEDAILDGAYDELVAAGYAAFSVEGVAARARTGKASIYRRWPTKQELVLDALLARMPGPDEIDFGVDPDSDVSTADALLAVARSIAATITSPVGAVFRAVKFEIATDPQLAALVDERFQAPRRAALLGLLQRGVARGEVRPDAANALIADVLPAVLVHQVVLQRKPATEQAVRDVVEQVMIPLVSVDR